MILTRRQKQISQYICRGHTNKAISHEMGLSDKTIKAHISGIFKALNCTNRVQLVLKLIGHDTTKDIAL